jgi:hypothetical protein
MTITIDELTKNEINGTGVFDELMRSVKAHLQEEVVSGALTPVNYASVYLGALQSTMALSVEFLLNKDKANASVELLKAQKLNVDKEREILNHKLTLASVEVDNSPFQYKLLSEQLDKAKEELLVLKQDRLNAIQGEYLPKWQIDKIKAEIALYNQKAKTEKAQILDKVDAVDVAGITGVQKAMYKNQSDGYLRLAEQQNARLLLDAFAVLQSNAGLDNFDGDITFWGVTPSEVKDAVDKLQAGVPTVT